jgi:hypothetical protein
MILKGWSRRRLAQNLKKGLNAGFGLGDRYFFVI